MNAFSAVLAVVVGFVLWGLTLALSGGVAPLGKTGGVEALLFFSPIVIYVVPLVLRMLGRGKTVTALWMAALAPMAGVMNFYLGFRWTLIGKRLGWFDASGAAVGLMLALAWGAALVLTLAYLRQLDRGAHDRPPP
jgi:hypothetical protein